MHRTEKRCALKSSGSVVEILGSILKIYQHTVCWVLYSGTLVRVYVYVCVCVTGRVCVVRVMIH